jgi:hypothetical protein
MSFHSAGGDSHVSLPEFDSPASLPLSNRLVSAIHSKSELRNNSYVYTVEPKKETVEFTWRDEKPEAGKTSYYYLRGEQQDGEIVWASPMWITYRASQ